MKADREIIELISANMQYIQLGLNNENGNAQKAQWLFHLLKSYEQDVQQRAQSNEEV